MYVFVPWYYAGIDFVYITYEKWFQQWNLISWGEVFGICLWENISFVERYNKERFPPCKVENIQKSFFSENAIKLIHRMVEERFTTYKKVIPLFLPKQRNKYLNLSLNVDAKPKNILSDKFFYKNWFFTKDSKKQNWQQLFVFPDLWTLYNSFENSYLQQDWVKILYSSMTDKQKMTTYNDIKSWNINTLLATSSEIFQDWYDLQHIFFVDPYKWYYESFQDPRYKISDVLNKIAEIYGIQVQESYS